jgi:ribosomal protein S12 methylthiotransferase
MPLRATGPGTRGPAGVAYEGRNVHIVSLGCAKNRVDTEEMVVLLRAAGWQVVAEPEQAEAILVNTCAFIRPAAEESIDTILDLARFKTSGRCRRLVVAGCLPQRYGRDLAAEMPEVDAFLGVRDRSRIVEALTPGESVSPSPDSPADSLLDQPVLRESSWEPHSAFLKISDGCDHRCAFCVIPSIRGPMRSRPLPVLVAEAEHLARSGVRELNLVAQDSMSWGRDLASDITLTHLLRALCAVAGLEWIRIHYAFPSEPPAGLLDVMAGEEKICRYLDIPMQHASDRVLRAMRRGVTRERQERLLGRLVAEVPGIAIRTTFIVGFPGEDDADFEELLDFVKTWRFTRLGVFPFWAEDGTPAAAMPAQVPPRVASRRMDALVSAQAAIRLEEHRRLIGSTQRVLVDRASPEEPLWASAAAHAPDQAPSLWEGRLESQAPEVDGRVYLTSPDSPPVLGQFVTARVLDVTEVDLYAELST